MSTRKTAAGTLVAAAATLALATSTALAATPVWQGCIEIKESGRFENSKCTTKGKTKSFDWMEQNYKAQAASSEGTLKVADTKTGVAVQCSTVKTERIGGEENASLGEVKEVKATGCETTAGTCATPTIEAVNLPWKTELTVAGTEVRDKLKSAVKSPGWKILCAKVALETCEGNTSAKTTNNEKEGLVEIELEGKSEQPSCSTGGKGEVAATGKLKATETGIGALRAVKAAEFKVTASPRVIAKNESSLVTIKALEEGSATKDLIVVEDPANSFKVTNEAIKHCEGKYKEFEDCTFGAVYDGNEKALFIVLVFDAGEGVSGTVVVGE